MQAHKGSTIGHLVCWQPSSPRAWLGTVGGLKCGPTILPNPLPFITHVRTRMHCFCHCLRHLACPCCSTHTHLYSCPLPPHPRRLPDAPEFALHPALVRRNDMSANSVNEWTGQRTLRDEDIPEDVKPASISPLGNYAVQISWEDGFNQIASFELLDGLRGHALPLAQPSAGPVDAAVGGVRVTAELA